MIRVAVVGLGPIGLACARAVRNERGMELACVVDNDPHKCGLSLSELTGQEADRDRKVVDDLDACADANPDVAIACTVSHFDRFAPLLTRLLERGIHVVSSCEQMAWPSYTHPALALQVDAVAKDHGVCALGTGVNPGFVMDAFAVMFTSVVRRVHAVRCVRRVDASLRREPLQRKVGATMTVERFQELARAGKIGHMGIAESVAMLGAGLGRRVESGSVDVTLEPVVAEKPTDSALGLIEPGRVAGMRNLARWEGEGLSIELDLNMTVGLEEPCDKIIIDGPVPLRMKIPGAIPGDSATVAMLLNYGRLLNQQRPGLLTMLDVPPAGCRGIKP